jgi:hypothetical protein
MSRNSSVPSCALLRHVGGQVGLDHHLVADRGGAGHHRLALALDLDHALAAGADGVEQRVVAEARHDRAELLGGPDDERPLRDGHLLAVDRQRDGLHLVLR